MPASRASAAWSGLPLPPLRGPPPPPASGGRQGFGNVAPPLPSNDKEARFKVSWSFLPHGSGLAFGYAGGAFFHEKDLHGREHDLEVFEEAGLGDIHQIHQELVVGRRIVLAIDLGIAGESALGLETEVPLRKFFFVLGGNLGALGAGAYDGHVAFQDVQ